MSATLERTIAALREALGDDRVRVGDQIGERSMTDWTGHAPAHVARHRDRGVDWVGSRPGHDHPLLNDAGGRGGLRVIAPGSPRPLIALS